MSAQIRQNLQRLRRRIQETARECGRDPSGIRLLAVSKTFPPRSVEEAYRAGQLLFGENRVQEAQQKIPSLRKLPLEWHLIGHLQSNKARRAVELFDCIQSIDSWKIAQRVHTYARELGKPLPVFLQVNVGEEPQKFGLSLQQAPELARRVAQDLPHLQLQGLMAIPPYHPEPEFSRPYFRRLRQLLEEINALLPTPLVELSMGMSHDFVQAIQEGATLLRIGSAIFGSRQT